MTPNELRAQRASRAQTVIAAEIALMEELMYQWDRYELHCMQPSALAIELAGMTGEFQIGIPIEERKRHNDTMSHPHGVPQSASLHAGYLSTGM